MGNTAVLRYQQYLDNLFNQISVFSDEIELQSHWARYLCVLVAGFVEISVRNIYGEYAEHRTTPNVANFVSSQLKGFQNPNMEKICQLTGSFSTGWAEDLRMFTDGELKDAVDSIIANRNLIAHGESVGVTFANAKKWYENVIKVIRFIDHQCTS